MLRRPPRQLVARRELELAQHVRHVALDGLHGEVRSEEHTSELQSQCNLVCRLLLEKKKLKTRRSCAISKTSVPRRASRATSTSLSAFTLRTFSSRSWTAASRNDRTTVACLTATVA